jgi:lipid-A-disaccharide synthase
MKYYIIAGEASGDLHGSNLIKGLKEADPDAQFRVWGGDLMQAQGAHLVSHYKETAVMGFVEVLYSIRKIFSNLNHCKKDILEYNPDIVILIDYPGFNFRIAKFAKENNLTVFYYISPKVWAWKEGRIKKLKQYTDRLFIIFPFEIEYFRKRGINAVYKGNPLIDAITEHPSSSETPEQFRDDIKIDNRPIIGLLPGSRMMEIKYLLPRMVKVAEKFPEFNFLLATAPSIPDEVYHEYIKETEIKLLKSRAYSIMKNAQVTILSSGTASLEAALLGSPQIVCYGGNEISYQIAKRLVKVKYVSLVNLILNKKVVKELLQHDCTPENIEKELLSLMQSPRLSKIKKEYEKIWKILGGKGASLRVAEAMIEEYNKIISAIRYSTNVETPIGTLMISSDGASITSIEHTDNIKHKSPREELPPVLLEARKQIEEYFRKERTNFDLPIDPEGTPFQKKVWQHLRDIPYGHVKSYGEIASLLGEKKAGRAVGSACRMNPLLLVVPCHRVIGSDKKLTGFNIGIDKKSYLLNHEEAKGDNEKTLF